MIESRLIRELREQQQAEDDLADFAEMLLLALEIPEVQVAVVDIVTRLAPARTVPPGTHKKSGGARGAPVRRARTSS